MEIPDLSPRELAVRFTDTKGNFVTATLQLALDASGCEQPKLLHRPRLLSDNDSSYVSSDLAQWLEGKDIEHVRGAPYHPQTQGKIERWHQTMKNRVLLENYYMCKDLELQISLFVVYYNNQRYHETSYRQMLTLVVPSRFCRKDS